MRRLLIMMAAATLLGPARAAAAPLGELPSTALAGAGSCLRATGTPGELVHDTDAPTEQGTPVELLRAGPGASRPRGRASWRDGTTRARPSPAGRTAPPSSPSPWT